ncbi:MAG: hypothetical protein BMS9Abin05_2516 [Rhodothermia bacterium]|nr:MAG: hypothetical protein BMS9Abin05_2516 [Rhodothermia bacterium]
MSSVQPRFIPLAILFILLHFTPVSGQSLLSKLQWQRLVENANKSFAENGSRLRPRNPDPLGVLSDSIRRVVYNQLNPPVPDPLRDQYEFVVSSWRLIGESEVESEKLKAQSTEWAFLGNTSLFDVDTLMTRDIRARLEHHFGPPTLTLAEETVLPDSTDQDVIEFEYWFVLNDSLPVVLIDVNGPWDRGVVMSVPSPYRDILVEIKEAFLEQLIDSNERMPFADYYFNSAQRQWYVTLFDGASYYDVRIDPPILELGRPRLGAYILSAVKPPE